MIKKMFRLFLLVFLLSLFAPFSGLSGYTYAATQETQSLLVDKLKALPGVVEVERLKCDSLFKEKYLVVLKQLLDPSNPSAGTFTQRVFVSHLDFSAPVVLVTEGYIADYASRPKYVEELAGMFGTNQICVEHRYFGKSVPENMDWKYLTAENAAYDHHHVVELFKTIYSGKWISTGISKGGQTALIHRALYPNDVDISVPYVAPLNFGVEDGRHEKFIDNVATLSDRKKIREFQLEVLKRRKKLTPMLERFCAVKHYTYNLPMWEVYDFCVLEYSFAFWQWGTSVNSIPSKSASDADIFNHFVSIAPPDYFSNEGIAPTQAFFVQAAKQLGYYGYETKPFAKYLKVKNAHGYLTRLFLPEGYSAKFDSSLSLRCADFLKKQDPKMIFIYGEYDPWFASAVEFSGKTNLLRAVAPHGSHLARIHSLPPELQKEVIDRIKSWLSQNPTAHASLNYLQKAEVQNR